MMITNKNFNWLTIMTKKFGKQEDEEKLVCEIP